MTKKRNITRRDTLQIGALSLGGLGFAGALGSDLVRLAASAETDPSSPRKAPADAVLFINLAGGPAHLDTLDMKPDAPAETRGEFARIDSRLPGVPVCEHLPKLAKTLDDWTLIRGISHSSGAHPQGQSYISTGNRPTPALVHPSYGSVVAKELECRPDLPPYVAIPATEWSAGYLGDAYAALKTNAVPRPGQPFEVRGVTLAEGTTVDKVSRRQQLLSEIDTRFRAAETNSDVLEALDKFGSQAHHMITSAHAQAAFDVGREPASISKRFTADEFNQSLFLAGRLIEHGVRFVTVTYQGWDTHTDNFKGHQRLLGPLDNGLPAVIAALKEKGLLDRTLVVAMGEFGRTPKINQNVGRDHYPRVNWCLAAGGGVRSGQLIGATDKAGASPAEGVEIKPDDLAATIYHSLGIDPHTEYYTKTGRPVTVVPHGRVMTELFA